MVLKLQNWNHKSHLEGFLRHRCRSLVWALRSACPARSQMEWTLLVWRSHFQNHYYWCLWAFCLLSLCFDGENEKSKNYASATLEDQDKHRVTVWPSSFASRLHTQERWKHSCTKTYTWILIALLFLIAKRCQLPNFPLADEWINKTWYIHTRK